MSENKLDKSELVKKWVHNKSHDSRVACEVAMSHDAFFEQHPVNRNKQKYQYKKYSRRGNLLLSQQANMRWAAVLLVKAIATIQQVVSVKDTHLACIQPLGQRGLTSVSMKALR